MAKFRTNPLSFKPYTLETWDKRQPPLEISPRTPLITIKCHQRPLVGKTLQVQDSNVYSAIKIRITYSTKSVLNDRVARSWYGILHEYNTRLLYSRTVLFQQTLIHWAFCPPTELPRDSNKSSTRTLLELLSLQNNSNRVAKVCRFGCTSTGVHPHEVGTESAQICTHYLLQSLPETHKHDHWPTHRPYKYHQTPRTKSVWN